MNSTTADQDGSLEFRAALRAARRLHKSGGGTVLDAFLRSMPQQRAADALNWLRAEAGVQTLLIPGQETADFSVLDRVRAAALQVVVLRQAEDQALVLGAADPWDEATATQVTGILGRLPALAAVSTSVLEQWLDVAGNASGLRAGGGPVPPAIARGASIDGPVVDFVDSAIRAAYSQSASDIHFECDRSGVTVKFRLDGVISRFARMDDPVRAEEVISRVKVMAQLDITERRVPQDGRIRFATGPRAIDLRVSIMPSVFGEDAVLRLLDKAQLRGDDRPVSLDTLGFDLDSSSRIRELAELPHGMLLVTGPTGSGKTTTVYAVLSEVNSGLEKIITIEDPVEYELPGVLQIPVNDRKGLTFAKGLRSILRHDPDRILVGEIRDPETAQIAVQSALTGHQVFTTVHANSLFDVTGRFRHFGLDMFGFMGALNGVVVQRLLRTICPHCAGTRDVAERDANWLVALGLPLARVPSPGGCDACHGTGYKGRSVVAEVHVVDDGFRDMVTSNAPLGELRAHVAANGPKGLAERGVRMVAEGRTTLEEVRRVVGWR